MTMQLISGPPGYSGLFQGCPELRGGSQPVVGAWVMEGEMDFVLLLCDLEQLLHFSEPPGPQP